MFKGLAVAVLIVTLLALAVLGPRWLMSGSEEESSNSLPICDVLEQTCQWEGEAGRWQVSLARKIPGEGNELHELRVQSPTDHLRMVAVLTGYSMYLGEYPVAMHKGNGDRVWQASFTPPYCSVDPTMTWRIELIAQRDLAIETPFHLVFTASGKG